MGANGMFGSANQLPKGKQLRHAGTNPDLSLS